MYIGKQRTPVSSLEKRVPRNPRFANVRPSLDTGSSASKVKHVSTKEFLRRQNELFSRLRPRDLADLLEAEAQPPPPQLGAEQGGNNAESANRPPRGPIGDREEECLRDRDRARQERDVDDRRDLLLLDVREIEDYRACHIHSAVSYPLVNINQDRLTTSMYRFKNKERKLIVVYDEDERLAAQGATGLVQRGFDNVRMLSGGLRAFGNQVPRLLQGDFPERLVQRKAVSPTESLAARREERRQRRRQSAGQHASSGEGLDDDRDSYAPSMSGCSVTSLASQRSTFSRAPRWKEDRAEQLRHRDILAKMHDTQLHGPR